MTANEFIEMKDNTIGEAWTDDNEEIAKALDEYAELKIRKLQETINHLFNHPEDVSIDQCNHCLTKNLYGNKYCSACKEKK